MILSPTSPPGTYKVHTRAEIIADAAVHGTGLVLAAIGVPLLLVFGFVNAASAPVYVTLPLYGAGLLAMLTCSALYNLTPHTVGMKEVFRRCDQAAIFLMIAGTYSPFALNVIGGGWGVTIFAVIWSLAALAAAAVFIFARRFEPFMAVVSLLMGWLILAALKPLVDAATLRVLVLLTVGGVIYTVGVVFHLWEKLPFQNAVWHACVVAAATVHYWAVADAVLAPGGSA